MAVSPNIRQSVFIKKKNNVKFLILADILMPKGRSDFLFVKNIATTKELTLFSFDNFLPVFFFFFGLVSRQTGKDKK